jgi:hypothetical protein
MTTRWIPARVAIDTVLGPYDAQIAAGEHWNGWAVPRFAREVVERIGDDTHALAERLDSDTVVLVRLRGQRAELVADPGAPEEEIETVEPDTDGQYAIGARAWTWEVAAAPANRPRPGEERDHTPARRRRAREDPDESTLFEEDRMNRFAIDESKLAAWLDRQLSGAGELDTDQTWNPQDYGQETTVYDLASPPSAPAGHPAP